MQDKNDEDEHGASECEKPSERLKDDESGRWLSRRDGREERRYPCCRISPLAKLLHGPAKLAKIKWRNWTLEKPEKSAIASDLLLSFPATIIIILSFSAHDDRSHDRVSRSSDIPRSIAIYFRQRKTQSDRAGWRRCLDSGSLQSRKLACDTRGFSLRLTFALAGQKSRVAIYLSRLDPPCLPRPIRFWLVILLGQNDQSYNRPIERVKRLGGSTVAQRPRARRGRLPSQSRSPTMYGTCQRTRDSRKEHVPLSLPISEKKSLTFMVYSGRQAALESQTSPLARFLSLPSPARAASEQVAAHRSAITLYLTRRLTDVSNAQKSQQETRVRRQMERSAKGGLGSTGIDQLAKQRASEHKSSAAAAASSSTSTDDVLSLYRPAPDPTVPDIDDILSPEQVQQFESEASALLEATNQELDAIRAAEASLLEISALQSELVVHLSQQTELTDRLWEEAVQVTGKVDEGNKQLKKAREWNRESRLWVLAFLLGASATLLFIEFY
jgi:hypothetical protein